MRKHNVDALVVIGGDGSFHGALDLYNDEGFNVMAILDDEYYDFLTGGLTKADGIQILNYTHIKKRYMQNVLKIYECIAVNKNSQRKDIVLRNQLFFAIIYTIDNKIW